MSHDKVYKIKKKEGIKILTQNPLKSDKFMLKSLDAIKKF